MEKAKIPCSNCERVASSGTVFNGKSPGQRNSGNINKLNSILLCLIEEELELSVRSQNCLNKANIKLIGQLVQKIESELLGLKSFGKNCLSEIKAALVEIGLSLGMNLDFSPWQGDSEGSIIIKILTMQNLRGGFNFDADLMKLLNIEFEKTKNEGQYSSLLLKQLIEIERDRPYLADVINRQKKWLQRQIK